MSKIPLRELETARSNPVAYAGQLKANKTQDGWNRSYFMDWRDAVLKWHTTGKSPLEARTELEATLEGRFKGRDKEKRIAETLEAFDDYVNMFIGLGYVPQKCRLAVTIPLLDDSVGIDVSGQLPVLARNGSSYIAIQLISQDQDWPNELRSPLLQFAVADLLNFLPEELTIGGYVFPSRTYSERHFTEVEILAARQELQEVASNIRKYL